MSDAIALANSNSAFKKLDYVGTQAGYYTNRPPASLNVSPYSDHLIYEGFTA